MKVWLDFDSRTESLGGLEPNDKWSRDSTSTTWNLRGAYSQKVGHHSANFDGSPGDLCYVVYVIYSTGDSFGNDEGAHVEVIAVCNNPEVAYSIKDLVEWDTKCDSELVDGKYPKLELPNGEKIYTYMWKGYFEKLDCVKVEMHKVN